VTKTHLYFELENYDRYHRADWEQRLTGWMTGAASEVERMSRPEDAEFIIETQGWHAFDSGPLFRIAPQSHYRQRPDATFAWDHSDLPTGRLPGLFCSLGQRLADATRHRSFCYPLRMNPQVCECPLSDAKYLFGFSGNVTSPLRARLFQELQCAAAAGLALLRQTESLFSRIYSPQSDAEKRQFIDDLRQCRFVLCPRGNGLSSIRLFETMEAARVPVIISDALVLPQCVKWSKCAIVVAERDVIRIPQLLANRESEWTRLALNARREWERCFSNETLLPTLIAQLREIVAARTRPEKNQQYFFPFRALPDYALVKSKVLVRRLQTAAHRARPTAS
jgi:hypothetical protein